MPLTKCPCGSGIYPEQLHDARGIFCTYYCEECEHAKREQFRPEIFTEGMTYGELGDKTFALTFRNPPISDLVEKSVLIRLRTGELLKLTDIKHEGDFIIMETSNETE